MKVKLAESCPSLCDPMDYTVRTRGRRSARGVGFSLTEEWRGRGLEILFILFSAGFQFSTMDCVPGLSSNRFRFSGKQAKESTSYKRPR